MVEYGRTDTRTVGGRTSGKEVTGLVVAGSRSKEGRHFHLGGEREKSRLQCVPDRPSLVKNKRRDIVRSTSSLGVSSTGHSWTVNTKVRPRSVLREGGGLTDRQRDDSNSIHSNRCGHQSVLSKRLKREKSGGSTEDGTRGGIRLRKLSFRVHRT